MYEDGKPVDSMVVVVGKTKYPTPMLAAYIRYAALNPYWYVPSDLAGEDVGQYVEKYGFSYFESMGYEEVSDWSPNPQIIDANKIDWDGVRDGKVEILLRQKPGPEEFHGAHQVHVSQRVRRLPPRQSAPGAVQGIGALLQRRLRPARGRVAAEPMAVPPRADLGRRGTEEPVMLEQPVPVYITYMTAVPDGHRSLITTTLTGATKRSWRKRTAQRANGRRRPLSRAQRGAQIGNPGDILRHRPAGGSRAGLKRTY